MAKPKFTPLLNELKLLISSQTVTLDKLTSIIKRMLEHLSEFED